MTERLYYTDAYLQTCDATVVRVEDRGGRTALVLDRTVFYPASGGQPFDTGRIEAGQSGQSICPVVDVIDGEDGAVVHIVEAPRDRLAAGQRVRGAIDWGRRFDHMQQHTGQHVLSAAIDRLFGVRTVSFHLGAEASSIDLSRELSRQEIHAAETEANTVIWQDRPVAVRFVSAEEAARLPLRKESEREGTLRLIDVEGFDLSACGGTHVARTGGIGIVAIGSTERFKGGQRVEFFCGGRAQTRFRSMHDTLAGAVRLLSIAPADLPVAIERLQAESRERQRSVAALHEELAHSRAEALAASADVLPAGRLVAGALDADANGLKAIASSLTARPGYIAVLVSTAKPAVVVVARSADVATAANQVIAALTARFGGRGGGKPDLAQAGGLDGDAAAILAAARGAIS